MLLPTEKGRQGSPCSSWEAELALDLHAPSFPLGSSSAPHKVSRCWRAGDVPRESGPGLTQGPEARSRKPRVP